jgi:hypothetical protein
MCQRALFLSGWGWQSDRGVAIFHVSITDGFGVGSLGESGVWCHFEDFHTKAEESKKNEG